MSHKAKIIREDKRKNSVRIVFELEVDGEKLGIPEADGKVVEQDFGLSYEQYRDSEWVQEHVKRWSEKALDRVKEEFEPSDSEEGKVFEF